MKSRGYRPRGAKGWTAERRDAAAKRAKAQKPWQNSTGPRSAAGKTKAAHNAVKHGYHSAAYAAELKRLHALLRLIERSLTPLDMGNQKCIIGGLGKQETIENVTAK